MGKEREREKEKIQYAQMQGETQKNESTWTAKNRAQWDNI